MASETLRNFLQLNGYAMERVSRGHKMVEVFGPKGPTKGECMREIVPEFYEKHASLIMACGDDVTDETMFTALPYCHADSLLSVKVGNGKSHAKYRVQNPTELRRLLKILHYTIATRTSSSA